MFKKRNDKFVDVGVTFEDVDVNTYALVDKVKKVGDKDDDFVVYKEPVVVDSYKMQKLVQANAKGGTLKELIAKVEKTGDLSYLNARQVQYGDYSDMPKQTCDAYDRAKAGAEKLASLSPEALKLLQKVANGDTDALNQLLKPAEAPASTEIKSSEVKTNE